MNNGNKRHIDEGKWYPATWKELIKELPLLIVVSVASGCFYWWLFS